MDLVEIKQIMFDEMYNKIHWNGEKSGKYYHGERVAKLALRLKTYIQPDDGEYDNIITVAGWFHDVMNGTEEHALAGAERTKLLLAEHCSEWEMCEIYNIIYKHDDRHSDRNGFSVYAKIQQDADFIDHFGSYDILLKFFCAARDGRTVVEEIKNMREQYESLYTTFEKELNYDISKKIYRERIEFYRQFSGRFGVEGTGGIWNEEIICIR